MTAYFCFKVWLHSRPGVGRTYYEGFVEIVATDETEAEQAARARLRRVHGHGDWHIDGIERRARR
jgi:hypothetical protein